MADQVSAAKGLCGAASSAARQEEGGEPGTAQLVEIQQETGQAGQTLRREAPDAAGIV